MLCYQVLRCQTNEKEKISLRKVLAKYNIQWLLCEEEKFKWNYILKDFSILRGNFLHNNQSEIMRMTMRFSDIHWIWLVRGGFVVWLWHFLWINTKWLWYTLPIFIYRTTIRGVCRNNFLSFASLPVYLGLKYPQTEVKIEVNSWNSGFTKYLYCHRLLDCHSCSTIILIVLSNVPLRNVRVGLVDSPRITQFQQQLTTNICNGVEHDLVSINNSLSSSTGGQALID